MQFFFLVGIVFFLTQCASIEPDSPESEVVVSDKKIAKVSAEQKTEQIPYATKKFKVEVFSCQVPNAQGTVLAINPDNQGFTGSDLCNTNEILQAFLSSGFDVIAMNRPGFGQSLPKGPDFSGPQTVDAVLAVLQKYEKAPIAGIWGYGTGCIAAAMAAKKSKKVNWLMLGAGIYDLEEYYNTTTSPLKGEIDTALKGGDKNAFFEERSVSWDTSNIPKRVYLYHGKSDDVTPMQQSKTFADTLTAEQFRVRFRFPETLKHDPNTAENTAVMRFLISTVKEDEKAPAAK